ncbi:leucyl aminopeptidase [Variovorax boronicumulans]|uniref:leucyl aminopeptidase n=1 Tax=Variovorax boronicumulans TaxID=436515 RepID=UPI001C59C5A8
MKKPRVDIALGSADAAQLSRQGADALVFLVSKDIQPGAGALSKLARAALDAGDLETQPGSVLMMYRPPGIGATRLILACIDDQSVAHVRAGIQAAIGLARSRSLGRLAIGFASDASAHALRTVVSAIFERTYVYAATKSAPETPPKVLEKVWIAARNAEALKPVLDRAIAIAEGVELARHWGDLPANHATPARLAEAAMALAKVPRFKCEVLGPQDIGKEGMRAFMAVAQGSAEPARFIVLRYEGARKSRPPVVLIGKGITFDSGGISIKPSEGMDEMKYDMAGGASVLGAFQSLARLKPPINVIGLIPACENLPGTSAMKPGDVVSSLNGQTIEILNTDAEGRLVLCDALTYAERFRPAAVIDVATLTGACVVALGSVRSGLFATDESLASALLAAGEAAQDPCWRMPLDDAYAESLKSNFADVANLGGRGAGSVTAAKFLQRFAQKFPWAHLDIAGVAWNGGAAKGATGRPVGLLVEYLLATAQEP